MREIVEFCRSYKVDETKLIATSYCDVAHIAEYWKNKCCFTFQHEIDTVYLVALKEYVLFSTIELRLQ